MIKEKLKRIKLSRLTDIERAVIKATECKYQTTLIERTSDMKTYFKNFNQPIFYHMFTSKLVIVNTSFLSKNLSDFDNYIVTETEREQILYIIKERYNLNDVEFITFTNKRKNTK